MNHVREQLTDYFKSELAELRSDALEFARDYPSIADELALNEGKSRDPHIELLLQSFSWMTGRLRQNMESETKQLPAMLLQQLYPQLVSSTPSMAIMECDIDGGAADFTNGYEFSGLRQFEPIKVTGKTETAAKLKHCRFSSCHPTTLWPLKVDSVAKYPINQHDYIRNTYVNGQSILDIKIKSSPQGAADGLMLDRPMRFYINLDEHCQYGFYDILAQNFLGAVIFDKNNERVATLKKEDLKFCGFDDNERTFPVCKQQELGFSLLFDYFSFPEKFLFFELDGMQEVQFQESLRVMLIFDCSFPKSIRLHKQALKLNCMPVVNLFQKTTEPVPLTHKNYRYKLFPSRENYESFEIYRVNSVHAMNRRGESRELQPYFSLIRKDLKDSDFRWQAQTDASHKKQTPGTETWLSLFSEKFIRDCPLGETVFANTYCCNRTWSELFNIGQAFNVIGSSPIKQAKLLTRPTRYRGQKANHEQLWKVLSHLSLYYVSLTDPKLAQDTLTSILGLYAGKENNVNQRQIESIENFTAKDDLFPVKNGGWRGYYHGVNFQLTLYDRKFDGSSTILFGAVLNKFLALFAHVNAFVRLELFVGNKKVYQWKPLSGNKSLV